MQKKLIALAIASAFSAPAFADNANFSFYGTADVSYDSINTGNGTTTANGATAVTGVTKQVVSSNVSKFGFKGSEDLGDGLSTIWQIEQQVNIDGFNTSSFATRNTFAGLKSESIGTVLMGRHDTPYKISARKLDVFGDNIADNRSLMGNKSNAGFELRPTDVLAYISPAFAGVTAAIATVNLTETNTNNTQKKNSALSMAVMYDAAPFYGSVAYEKHKLETVAAGANESATRLGFGFKPEGFELGVVYEKTTDNLGAGQVNLNGHNAFYVSGKMNIGMSAVKLAYTKAGVLGTGAVQVVDSGASQVSVGYDHGLSKRTKLYALYTRISNGKGINYGFSQSTAAATSNAGFGTSPSAISLGLKHTF
jgi:predicted porin